MCVLVSSESRRESSYLYAAHRSRIRPGGHALRPPSLRAELIRLRSFIVTRRARARSGFNGVLKAVSQGSSLSFHRRR